MSADRGTVSSRRFLVGAIAYAALLFAVSQVPGAELARFGFDIWDKAAHSIAYAPLGALVMGWLAFRRPVEGRAAVLSRCAVAIALTVGYGLLDELHQAFVPGRQPSFGDAAADLVGAAFGALAVALRLAIGRTRSRR
jgi:VanZ family protein